AMTSGPRHRLDTVQAPLGPVLDLPGKLTAGGVDILATRLADGGDQSGVLKDPLKSDDAIARAGAVLGVRKRIERNQIQFARHVANQGHELAGLLGSVVDVIEHHVFEGDKVTWRELAVTQARRQQRGSRI